MTYQPAGISIHALLAESDYQLYDTYAKVLRVFLSTLSLRRATWARGSRVTYVEFLSTLSLRRATAQKNSKRRCLPISIHALLAESDSEHCERSTSKTHFYPRSPCGERQHTNNSANTNLHFYPRSPCGERLLNPLKAIIILAFLSTLSLRRATQILDDMSGATNHFYPRSPCGERPSRRYPVILGRVFLSTLSLRRATK